MKYTTFYQPKLDKTFVCRKRTKEKRSKNQLYLDNPTVDQTDLWIVHEMPIYLRSISLEEDDVWADIGANIGAFGVLIHDKVKKVYGFEPHPGNCDVLKEQIKFNAMSNYELNEMAVVHSNEIKDINLYCHPDMACHTTSKKGKKTTEIINVPAISLNEILEKYPDINKIKLDVEGAEYDIILSYKHWNKIKEIYFEWHAGPNSDPDMIKYHEVIDHLSQYYNGIAYTKKLWQGVAAGYFNDPKN